MKICFPIDQNNGLQSMPYGHFGSAPNFLVVDSTTQECTCIDNGNLHHEHNKCQPLQALRNTPVDVVIVGGIGQGAISKLGQMGITVYKSISGDIATNLTAFLDRKLQALDHTHTCSHDNCGHH